MSVVSLARAPEPKSFRPRILIVEDDLAMGDALFTTLQRCGYETEICTTGTEGLANLLNGTQYDLLLLDIMLPGIDGITILKRVRATPSIAYLPVIMLTALAGEDHEIEMLEAGADDYIRKPFSFDNLLAHVEALLRRSALRDSNPLTGLAGNRPVERFLRQCARERVYFWAAAYVDIDNFKAYNDTYGFLQGDAVLTAMGEMIVDAARSYPNDVFAGHIGGDDFLLGFCKHVPRTDEQELSEVQRVLDGLINAFAGKVPQFYTIGDAARGYVEAEGRTGTIERHPVMSLSVAVVSNVRRVFDHPLEISSTFASLKHKAKTMLGNSVCYDQRRA